MIKVLVIDDSAFNRRALEDILNSYLRIEVVGTAVDGEDGLKKLLQLKPDVVTLDLEMPIMDGFTFIRMSMATQPTPIVVVSSKSDDTNVFKALELGAVDFIAKPTAAISKKLFDIRDELLDKVLASSQTDLENIKERSERFKEQVVVERKHDGSPLKVCSSNFDFIDTRKTEVIAIGASTGGPTALKELFNTLPVSLDMAIVISQHMPPGFTATFSQRLNENSSFLIKEAEDGEPLEKGKVLIAPGGYHLTFWQNDGKVLVKLVEGQLSDRNIPSVNMMFNSISEIFRSKVLGIVLTGMGSDGKEGVVRISENGGKVFAESEDSAVVFGMPNEAIKTKKVDKILPIHQMSDIIVATYDNQ